MCPDLRDRFIVGAGNNYSRGDTGGADSVTLTTAQMPQHNHGINILVTSTRLTIMLLVVDIMLKPRNLGVGSDGNANSSGDTNTKTTGITIQNEGDGNSHENRPPYYALIYIINLQTKNKYFQRMRAVHNARLRLSK